MEVVIAFTECEQRDNVAVTRSALIAVREIAPPVSQTVDEESSVLNENSLSKATNEETAEPVTPAEASN